MKKLMLSLSFMAITLASCSDDDDATNPIDSGTANFTVSIENIGPTKSFVKSGIFDTPVGETTAGAATPGNKFEFTVQAGRSHHLSFATMLAATNDLFFGPDDSGIALYNEEGDPISGDITDQIYLWDAGTEVNEEPAVGPDTVTNQSAPNTGEDENAPIRKIEDVETDTFAYPGVNEIISVNLEHIEGTEFKVTIEDSPTAMLTTSEGEIPVPLSPGVWVVYNAAGSNPLYMEGELDIDQGIEAIAEDGDPEPLGTFATENTGVTYPASPGGWIVHQDGTTPLFTDGIEDFGDGIEAIAEDGDETDLGANISTLEGYIAGAVFNTPAGNDSAGPILPGDSFEFSFEASAGDRLSFATMLAATNDIFFGTEDAGIALFDAQGKPVTGDVTSQIYLWDAGTEVNEEPAIGPNTVTNQPAPNTGREENNPVSLLSEVVDGYNYPAVNTLLKVIITTK